MNRPRRNYKTNKKVEHIGDLLSEYFGSAGGTAIAENVQIMGSWSTIVGERIATVTRCDGIKDGVLKVHVINAVWRHELMYMKNDILKKIKDEIGLKTIREIAFY